MSVAAGYQPPTTDVFLFAPWVSWTWFGVHFAINKITLLLFVGVVLVAGFFLSAFRSPQVVPGRLQNVAESFYDLVRNTIARDVVGPEGIRFAPYLTALFFFIFVMNIFEIVPVAQVPVTSRIAFPAFLALISYLLFNVIGIRRKGVVRYFRDIMFPPGVPWPLYFLLTPIELVSTLIIRPFTLAVRLFANMFAGHILLLVFFTATTYLLTVGNFSVVFSPVSLIMSIILTAFELLIDVLQAYIFTLLTALYVSGAIAEEH